MIMSCIGITIFLFVEIVAAPPLNQDKPITTPKQPEGPDITPPLSQYDITTKPCRGDDCRPPPNLVPPIVGSLCAVLVIALIAIFLVWFYLRRKIKKSKEVPKIPEIKFIEQPPLYTGAISTTDSSSRLYGMNPSRNDSITSHYYEKINYNERR